MDYGILYHSAHMQKMPQPVLFLWQEQCIGLQDSSESQLQQRIFRKPSGAMGVLGRSWIGTKVLVTIHIQRGPCLEDQDVQQNAKLSPGNELCEYVA